VAAVAAGDAARVIELTDPQEDGVVHDYAPLWMRRPIRPPAVDFTRLDLASSPVSGGTMVTVTDFTARVGRADVVSLSSDGCFRFARPGTRTEQVCQPRGSNLLAGYGIVTVRRGTSWYLDPYRTAVDDLEHVVRGLDLGELSRLAERGGSAAVLAAVAAFLGRAPGLPGGRPFPTSPAAAQTRRAAVPAP
jgi:hypothetical protein